MLLNEQFYWRKTNMPALWIQMTCLGLLCLQHSHVSPQLTIVALVFRIDLGVLALTNSNAVILNACPPPTIHHSFVIVLVRNEILLHSFMPSSYKLAIKPFIENSWDLRLSALLSTDTKKLLIRIVCPKLKMIIYSPMHNNMSFLQKHRDLRQNVIRQLFH